MDNIDIDMEVTIRRAAVSGLPDEVRIVVYLAHPTTETLHPIKHRTWLN